MNQLNKFSLVITVLIQITSTSSAQHDTTSGSVSFSGYAEIYYSYDFNEPEDHNRPSFFYSHNRHNEFNLNLGFLKASYTTESVRANVALATGTYMNANYSAEPGVLQNIYEANAGIKLCKNSNLWVDAGIFGSHIGFETAVSKDCWGLTRSILAENSPYYESGAKLTFISDNSKWLLSGLVLNGWQHIKRPDGNNSLAFGTQIMYTPDADLTINYSTFIGNDKPDTSKQMRYFHNLYGMFHITDKFHVTAGLDFGMEQEFEGSSGYNEWYSPVLILMVVLNDQWSVTGRGEFYSDEKGVIIATGTPNGFQTAGLSINFDYRIRQNAVWRVEGRMLSSEDKVFVKGDEVVNTNSFVTTSIAISF